MNQELRDDITKAKQRLYELYLLLNTTEFTLNDFLVCFELTFDPDVLTVSEKDDIDGA